MSVSLKKVKMDHIDNSSTSISRSIIKTDRHIIHCDAHWVLILSMLYFHSDYPLVCSNWKELLYKKVWLYLPFTHNIYIHWEKYSNIIGVVLPLAGQIADELIDYITNSLDYHPKLEHQEKEHRLNTKFDFIQRIVTNDLFLYDEAKLRQLLQFMPRLSEITIISDVYDHFELGNVASKMRSRLTLNGYHLKPCLQCNQLCYPPSACGEKCQYVGTYNCEKCIIVTLGKHCIVCERDYHDKCIKVHESIQKAIFHNTNTCTECLLHDGEDIYRRCESCLELNHCRIDDCIEQTCYRHTFRCRKCKISGCIGHIMRVRENYVEHQTDLICYSCYRKSVMKARKRLAHNNTLLQRQNDLRCNNVLILS